MVEGDLTRVAVNRPEELKPDQLEDAAIELVTRAIENELGEPIDPAGLHISYGRPSKPIETLESLLQEGGLFGLGLREFGLRYAARAHVMAAWLFPELRRTFAAGAENDALRRLLLDEEALGRLALSAMNDVSWEHGLAALKSLSTKARN